MPFFLIVNKLDCKDFVKFDVNLFSHSTNFVYNIYVRGKKETKVGG